MVETRIYNSLTPIYFDKEPAGASSDEFTMCANQQLSFQLAYKITDGAESEKDFYVRVESDIPVSNYYINNVPVPHTAKDDADFSAGMYPDILLPKKTNPKICEYIYFGRKIYLEQDENVRLRAYDDSWQGLWFVVNENSKVLSGGTYKIKLELVSKRNEVIACRNIIVNVIPEKLPAQKLIYTNWFHNDCLADFYGVPVFSERYFEIFADFVKKASLNGMNMILLPAFTPPLDTPVGGERMTVQLVDVVKKGKKYEFDFSLMKRYIDICRKNGITHFEHSHFFSQWGAEAAPKVMATVNGRKKRIFGWDTKADSPAYTSFLTQYITELKKFLKAEKLEKKILFHISDEPQDEHIPSYSRARNSIIGQLEGYTVGDALSHYEIYEKGLCTTPIVSTASIKDFIGKVDDLWAYYVGGTFLDGAVSNRVFRVSRERNRMLGVQMYYHDIKGFLHWGYNNYYGELSKYMFNPAMNPCGGFPLAGTSYSVYPAFDGTCYQSVRQKVFAEGICDMRLLCLLEKLTSRSKCREFIEKHFGVPSFDKAPDSAEAYTNFINELYAEIKNAASK